MYPLEQRAVTCPELHSFIRRETMIGEIFRDMPDSLAEIRCLYCRPIGCFYIEIDIAFLRIFSHRTTAKEDHPHDRRFALAAMSGESSSRVAKIFASRTIGCEMLARNRSVLPFCSLVTRPGFLQCPELPLAAPVLIESIFASSRT